MKNCKFAARISKIYNSISIKNKIFLFNLVIIFISLFVLAYYADSISTKAIIDKAVKNSNREILLIDNSLQTFVNDVEDYSRILSSDYRLQNELVRKTQALNDTIVTMEINAKMSEILSNILKPNTAIIASNIMASNNVFFDVGGADSSSAYKFMSDNFISYVQDKRVPVWTGLLRLGLSNGKEENAFGIVKSIIHKDLGTNIGISILYVAEKQIAAIYSNSMGSPNDRFFILDNEGLVISAQKKDELYHPLNAEQLGIKELPKEGNSIFNADGKKYLLTIHYFKKLDWRLVSLVSLDEITTEKKDINRMIIFVGILCLMFAFAASLALSNNILKPLKRLVNVMNNIEQGKLDKRVDINKSDELGLLSKGFNRLMDKINNLLQEIYLEQKKRREYEYKLLQAQVNPHFLYNTVETIISLITLDMKDDAVSAAKNLASFYRISLSKGRDMITVKEEMQLITAYLSIQKQRYFDYMEYELDFAREILDKNIPKLTVQPLAENAIYHGLKPKGAQGKLKIGGYMQDDKIILEVFDNGIGISRERIEKILNSKESPQNGSFGLMSVDERIKMRFGSQYGLRIESEQGKYTKVSVILPVKDKLTEGLKDDQGTAD